MPDKQERILKSQALARKLGAVNITDAPLEEVSSVRIENCVGFIKVPLGIAGPLKITGEGTDGDCFAALATTEGTIVAAVNRGAKAFNRGGGFKFHVFSEGVHRSPILGFDSIDAAIQFTKDWPKYRGEFVRRAEATSSHMKFIHDKLDVVGCDVHLKLKFFTGGAAGQNMATVGSQAGLDWLVAELKATNPGYKYSMVEGLAASDKQMSRQSLSDPRGVEVMAWGNLTDEACREMLGMSSKALYEVGTNASRTSVRIGNSGVSANAINVVAAIFAATGQDIASVAESAWCHSTFDYDAETKNLQIGIYWANLVVGVVGGGTGYPTQKESLKIMGCDSPDSKHKLAGLIAAFSLCLDVSTYAALYTNEFTQSHWTLGRGNKGKVVAKL